MKFYLLTLAVCLSACQSDMLSTSGEAILSPGNVSIASMQTGATRATAVEGAIGIFRGGSTLGEANVKYTRDSGAWATWQRFGNNPAPGMLLSETVESFAAYYPYNAGQTTAVVTVTPRIYSVESDVSGGYFTASALQPAPSVMLEHCYARIKLRLVRSTDHADLPAVTRLVLDGLVSSGTYDLLNRGIFTPGTGVTQLAWNSPLAPVAAGASEANSAGATADFLVVPFTPAAEGVKLTLEGNPTFSTVLPKEQFSDGACNARYCYTWDVTVGATGLTATPSSGALEQGWVPGTTASGSLTLPGELPVIPLGATEETSANCYVVVPGRQYLLNTTYEGNGVMWDGTQRGPGMKLGATVKGTPAGAHLVWQSAPGLVTQVSYGAEGIRFGVNSVQTSLWNSATERVRTTGGNALVAVTAADGTILWSWHLWVVDSEATQAAILAGTGTNNRYMDRNLGALGNKSADKVLAYGLMYQWGRKEPFPGSRQWNANVEPELYDGAGKRVEIQRTNPSPGGTLAYAVKTPLMFMLQANSDWLLAPSGVLWGSANVNDATENEKTRYDPCPVGWKVPALGQLDGSGSSMESDGRTLPASGGWYPLTGFRSAAWSGGLLVRDGYIWYSSIRGAQVVAMSVVRCTAEVTNRGHGFPVRCIKE